MSLTITDIKISGSSEVMINGIKYTVDKTKDLTALKKRIKELEQYLLGAQKLIQEELYSTPITFQEIRGIIRQKYSNITEEF